MAVTLSVEDGLVYVSTILGNQRLNVNGLQPGIASANNVLQRMLGAPFIWRFNRANFSISLIPPGKTEELIATLQLTTSGGEQTAILTFNTKDTIPVGTSVAFAGMTTYTAINGMSFAVVTSAPGTASFALGAGAVTSDPNPETGTMTWTAENITDYTVSVPYLGRIETQWLVDGQGTVTELKGTQTIAKNSVQRRPTEMGPVYDDNQGNITFRCNSVPDQRYTAYFDYQQKAVLITGPGFTFAPVPDEFGYLFNKGLLAECGLLVNDARFTIWEQEFVAGLLATQDGLDAQAKDMFYNQMLNSGRTSMRSQTAGNSGAQGRQQY